MLGVVLSIIPIAHFLAFGYLLRIFQQGKAHRDIVLPEWNDLKGLFVDGLKFFVIFLIFACIPIILMLILVMAFPWDTFLSKVPLAPAYFLAGPLSSAALYLYLLSGDFSSCFNIQAVIGLVKKGLNGYWVITLAFLGLLLMLPFAFFIGGVVYFYLMGRIFKNLELAADKP